MEVFVGDRGAAEATALVARLKALGLRGRDAAYLASAAPPAEAGPEQARYWKELAFMVPAAKRPAVCAVLGIRGPERREAA
ncbi:MAG: hypothetical protein JO013_04005 [Alphaproteobacteria bacterium]|nr:hypothetical protein [Alphaproteobacteria bacterium]